MASSSNSKITHFIKESEHLCIPYQDIKQATKNFTTLIGKGGYGLVYKGELLLSGILTVVAVKRLDSSISGQGLKEFLTEIHLLSRHKHPNLVSLLGFCEEHDEKIIIYDYAEHGSLDKYLTMGKSTPPLTWMQRISICVDAARGLDYLHNHVAQDHRVIHRDIKSANVLLGQDWKAMIADFGLSKIGRANENVTFIITNASGTHGYCDPAYMDTGILTKESDVYSFGVVLFEVLCGRLCFINVNSEQRFLAPLAKRYYEKGRLSEIIDPYLKIGVDSDSLNRFSEIAYQCLLKDREQRPSMGLVVQKLEKMMGQQQFSPSPYNNPTGGRHLEPNYDVSKYTPERDHGARNSLILNGQMNQSLDNDNHQKFASRPVSQNTDHVYDYNQVNNRFEDGAEDNYFQPPPMNDGVDSNALEEDGPGIEGFQIIGDAKPGGKLLGCGFPVRGTSLCMFQWVRHLQDGTREYIEGATNPEYVVTADDVDKLIAVECIPMDDQGRQGEIVRLFANEQNKITCDPEMQQELDKYMSAGQASFSVLLLMDSSENWEQTTFSLRRSNYQIKINRTQDIIINERYTNDLSIKIPSGLTTQFVLTRPNGSSHPFNTFHDVRMRDTLVLTMRMFQGKALDERRKTKA